MKMSGHTVLITGGTSGIGKALATQLLKRGNTVLITGRSEDRLAEARQALLGVHTYVCDQSDPDAIERLRAEATRDFPALDVLINNAGIGVKRNLNDPSTPAVAMDFNKGQEEMNAGPRMDADVFARAALRGLEKDRDEVLPGPAKALRLMGRLKPHATLRAALAAAMGK